MSVLAGHYGDDASGTAIRGAYAGSPEGAGPAVALPAGDVAARQCRVDDRPWQTASVLERAVWRR